MCSTGRRPVLVRVAAPALLAAAAIGSLLAHPAAPRAESDSTTAPRLHIRLAATDPGARAAEWLRVGGAGSFAGTLTVQPSGPHVAVVNEVALEDYVRGIAEMPSDWPLPALEAQAIAARTYGVYHVLVSAQHASRSGGESDICATDYCQVYRGLPQGEARPRWLAAVAATSGQVLLYRGGVIEAFYASSDGGRTRSGGVPWLPSIADPDDSVSPLHHWTWSAPLASFAPVVGVPASALVDMSSTTGGVVVTVQQPGAATAQRTIDGDQFQQDVNQKLPDPPNLPMPLPGPYYSLTTQSGVVQVEGWGFGHGLGMSQYGALGKSLRGLSATRILGAYYGPARAVRMPANRIPHDVRVLVSDDQSSLTIVGSGEVQVVDDSGRPVGDAPTGALTVDIVPGGVRARVIPRPALTDVPVPATAPHGRIPTFADVRPSLLQAGAPSGPPTGSAPAATPAPAPPAADAAAAAPTAHDLSLVAGALASGVRAAGPAAASRAHTAVRTRRVLAVLGSLAALALLTIGVLAVRVSRSAPAPARAAPSPRRRREG